MVREAGREGRGQGKGAAGARGGEGLQLGGAPEQTCYQGTGLGR